MLQGACGAVKGAIDLHRGQVEAKAGREDDESWIGSETEEGDKESNTEKK